MSMNRLCIKCNIEKSIEEFLKEKTKDGYGHRCKACVSKYLKEYHQKNKDRLSENARQNYLENKSSYLKRSKKQRESNPKKYKEYLRKWRKENKDYLNQQMVYRLHTDVNFKLKHTLRNKFRKLIKGANKTNSALVYVGCDIQYLKGYLEAKFQPEMSWDNYGVIWHIDHVLPCRYFDLTTEEGKKKCFHYSNLQPLLVIDNLQKLDKLPNGKCARYENRFDNDRPKPVSG